MQKWAVNHQRYTGIRNIVRTGRLPGLSAVCKLGGVYGIRKPTPVDASIGLSVGHPIRLGAPSPARRNVHPINATISFDLPSLLPVQGPWGVWAALAFAGAFGLWSERWRLGKELSGALVATLMGMILSNIGVLPHGAAEYGVVTKYLLPLAIPMLLFSANLRRVLSETGRLLFAFLLGAATTVAGTVLAMNIVPLTALAGEGWKIAAALQARHIGGAVNYVAVTESLSVGPSAVGAGLAADDLILVIYFSVLYSLAKAIPPEAGVNVSADQSPPQHSKQVTLLEGITALTLSTGICYLGTTIASSMGMPSQSISVITACTVAAATLLPKLLAPFVASAEGLALMLMQVFFATVGANARVMETVQTAPILFVWSFVAIGTHLVLLLLLGPMLGFSRRDLLLASNANIGGPSTVAGMAASKGWNSQIVPAILSSTLGYAIGTFVGLTLGVNVLRPIDYARL